MDIGIFITFEGQVVQIPVNPSTFTVSTEGKHSTVEIILIGDIIIPKKMKLSNISWESFFPYESWHPAIRTKGDFRSAQFYLDFLAKIRNACKPCRLTVTGINYDDEVVIDSFEYYHKAGDHEDTYYSISLTQYRPYAVSILSKNSSTNTLTKSTAVGTVSTNSSTTPTAKEITIGCDVILNGVVHYDSYGSKPGKTFTNYKCKVSLINKKGTHCYHVTTPSGGWLGWVAAESVVLA